MGNHNRKKLIKNYQMQKQQQRQWEQVTNYVQQLTDINYKNKEQLFQQMIQFSQECKLQLIQSIDFAKLSIGNIDNEQLFQTIQYIANQNGNNKEEKQKFNLENKQIKHIDTKISNQRYKDVLERYDIRLDRSFNLARKGHQTYSQNTEHSQNISKAYSEPERVQGNASQLFMVLSSSQVKDKKNQLLLHLNQNSNENISQEGMNSARNPTNNYLNLNEYFETGNDVDKLQIPISNSSSIVRNSIGTTQNNNFNQISTQSVQNQSNHNNNNLSNKNTLSVNIQNNEPSNTKSGQNVKIESNSSLFDKDPFREFTDNKIKEIVKQEGYEQVVKMRQQAIEYRLQAQVEMLDNLLREKTVSPRTYENKRIELESWVKKEREDLKKTADELEKGWKTAIDSINKTRRDMEFAKRFMKNPNQQNSNKSECLRNSQSDFDDLYNQQNQQSTHKQLRSEDNVGQKTKSAQYFSSDKQQQKKNSHNQNIYLEVNDIEHEKNPNNQPSQQGVKLVLDETDFNNKNSNNSNDKLVLKNKVDLFKANKISPRYEETQQVSNNTLTNQGQTTENISQNTSGGKIVIKSTESIGTSSVNEMNELKEDMISENKQILDEEKVQFEQQQQQQYQQWQQQQQIANQNQIQQQSQFMEEIFMEMNEEMNEKWRMLSIIEARVSEQLEKTFIYDKSENYGIPTNLCVIQEYIQSLFSYVLMNYKDEFIKNINTPFGFSPNKRLKLIHGYDSFVEQPVVEDNQQLEDEYVTLPFVLSEDLFIEFEQNVIGNGDNEKEQIIKEFEHIHNKSIFDSFNEALNMFRPYYGVGGPPYAWSKSDKIALKNKQPFILQLVQKIQEQSLTKVLKWSSFLCGLVNEAEPILEPEEQEQYSIKNIQFDPNRPLASLVENLPPEHESFMSIKEEKLSKMLLTEILENDYKWCLYQDEQTEVVMELADLVFEDMVEDFVDELYFKMNVNQSQNLQQGREVKQNNVRNISPKQLMQQSQSSNSGQGVNQMTDSEIYHEQQKQYDQEIQSYENEQDYNDEQFENNNQSYESYENQNQNEQLDQNLQKYNNNNYYYEQQQMQQQHQQNYRYNNDNENENDDQNQDYDNQN